jgi:hypothetical protein
VEIDYSRSFPASDFASWEAEYDELVFEEQELVRKSVLGRPYLDPPPWADDFTRGLGDLWLQSLPDDVHQDLLMELCDA